MSTTILVFKVEKLFTLFVSYLAFYWVLEGFSIEAIISFLSSVFVFIVLDFKETPSRVSGRDIQLFEKITKDLPSTGSIGYIKDIDMGAIFEIARLSDLFNFIQKWSGSEYEFKNKVIEAKKVNLIGAVKAFLDHWSINTFQVSKGFNKIPDDWRDSQKERYEKVKQQLGILADDVVKAHSDFFNYTKKIF